MLSALVQSQAAIIAIVVSLTLIAVQLTAASYSPRVIDIFQSPKKNPDLWILIGFYGSSIFYGLFLLKLVKEGESVFVNQSATWPSFYPILSFEHGVSIAYWLGAFTFVILVPYIWTILNLLKPETIINRLATEITKDALLNLEDDPIQPIIDIVHGSIMKYDLETTRIGLKVVTERVIEIIETEINPVDGLIDGWQVLDDRFCTPVAFAGKLAVNRDDEKSTLEVIENLQKSGKAVVKKVNAEFAELEGAAEGAAVSLLSIGVATSKSGLQKAAADAAKSLAALAALNKEIVEKADHKFKSKREDEENHDAYHEFMVLYNKELEELRKEKEKKNAGE